MQKIQTTLLRIGAAVFVAAGAASASQTNSMDAAGTVVEQFHAALKAGNADAAVALLAKTALIYESGHAETRDEYISHHLAADIAFAKDTQRTVKSTRNQCEELMCVVMQSSEISGTYKGKPVRSVSQETTVLRREGNTWKIQHVHWSSAK